MFKVVLVFLGSGVGAVARHKLGGFVLHHLANHRFPFATFLVNVAGCIVAGLIAGAVERHGWFTADTRVFLFTGLLGGFTTFSAFGLETVALLKRGDVSVALAYVALSVLCGMVGLWLGISVVPRPT